MINLIQKSLLNYFGISKMGFHWSKTCQGFKDDIINAIENDQIIVIPGEVGAGKTTVFNEAAKSMLNTKFIYVRNYFKENLTIAGIINAVIYDLSDESPKRDLEARSRQFIRIAGEKAVKENLKINIVIEEAHRLHKNTLRALKELREASYAGRSPFFSISLIGHPELMTKVEKRREVYWRAQVIEFNESAGWMQFNERVDYIKNVFGSAVNSEARKNIAVLCKQPLEITKYIYDKMRTAKKIGSKQLTEEIVQPSLSELMSRTNISYGKIAKETGIPRSTVHDAVHIQGHRQAAAVEAAIKKLAALELKKAS